MQTWYVHMHILSEFLFYFYHVFLMCMYILPVCIPLYYICEDVVVSPSNRVIDCYELPHTYWESNPGTLGN